MLQQEMVRCFVDCVNYSLINEKRVKGISEFSLHSEYIRYAPNTRKWSFLLYVYIQSFVKRIVTPNKFEFKVNAALLLKIYGEW